MRLFACLCLLLLVRAPAQAQDPAVEIREIRGELGKITVEMRGLAADHDREDSAIRQQIAGLSDRIDRLDSRVVQFEDNFTKLMEAIATAEGIDARLATLDAEITAANTAATNAEIVSGSIRWIVTVASVLITAFVVIFGALFSQRFIDLKSDARVATEVLARVERQIEKLREDPAKKASDQAKD